MKESENTRTRGDGLADVWPRGAAEADGIPEKYEWLK